MSRDGWLPGSSCLGARRRWWGGEQVGTTDTSLGISEWSLFFKAMGSWQFDGFLLEWRLGWVWGITGCGIPGALWPHLLQALLSFSLSLASISLRACQSELERGGGIGAQHLHQLGKQLTLVSAHYYLVLVKRVLRIAQVLESSSSSLLTRKKRNISRQPASMLRLFCQAQSFKNITRSFEHGPVLSRTLYWTSNQHKQLTK